MKTRNSAWCLLSLYYTVGYQRRVPICPFPGKHIGKQCYVKRVVCNLKYGCKQASLCSKDRVYESQHESMDFANSEYIHPKYSFHMRKCGLSADSLKEHDTAKLAPAERKQWGGWINTAGEGKEAGAQQEFTSPGRRTRGWVLSGTELGAVLTGERKLSYIKDTSETGGSLS